MTEHGSEAPLWGVAAEFETAEGMVAALYRLRDRRLGRLDAFAPVPIPEAAAALRLASRPMYPLAIAAVFAGAAAMFGFCTYGTIWGYRFDIGGRPLFSWPAFVVPSVSFGMLVGTAVLYGLMLLFCRLPRLNHPAFNIGNFTRVTADRFYVAVEARDDRFDAAAVEAALATLPTRPSAVRRVPR